MVMVNGIVKNGVIVLEEGAALPSDGTQVRVMYAVANEKSANGSKAGDEALNKLLLRFAGKARGKYPKDMARQHDHYLYGTPKRPESK